MIDLKKQLIILLSFLAFLCSCEKGIDIEGGKVDTTTALSLINWTGHWDDICSPGQTLTFIVRVGDESEVFEIIRDSGDVYKGKINVGDLVKVQVLDEDGNVILSGQRNFELVQDESFLGVNSGPTVRVCDIGNLEFSF